MFVPSLEVRIAGVSLSRKTSMSLYQINTSRALVRHFIARYHRTPGHKLGAMVANKVMPHTGGHLHEALDDATSAMATLDDISDEDATTGSKILVVTVWSFLALCALMGALVFGELMRALGPPRKSRFWLALVISVVTLPVALGTLVLTRALVWEANDEAGVDVLATTVGAYVIPVAAILGLVAIIGALVRFNRPGTR